MKLPNLARIARSRSAVTAFAGYDHTAACAEGEWYEEENLSARSYPALAPRLPRTLAATLTKPHGLYAKNGLIWVDGTQLFYNGEAVGTVADSDKTFCGIGTKVLIWPDKVYLDTADQTLHALGAKWASVGDVQFVPAREDGTAYTIKTTGAEEPTSPENGDYWLDTSGTADVLRVYSAANAAWSAISTTYLQICAASIGKNFARYDTVTVAGVTAASVGTAAETLNGDLIVWNRSDDTLTVTGLLKKSAVQSHEAGEITVERRIPDLDFLAESDNRVWGCASAAHAIYACKLGDPTNWFSYMGTAADSYTASVGSDGNFTGAAVCLGYVLFFKQNLIHKVYGTKPANYQLTTVACRGVCTGGAKTLVTAGETLYYLSADGVMQYDGSLPACISAKLGPARFTGGAAGAAHGEVRFALDGADGSCQWFCYDTARGIWHKENGDKALAFTASGESLYALSAAGGLWAIGCENDPYAGAAGHETAVSWYGETGDIGLYTADHKYVSRLEVRLEAEAGTKFKLEAQYDASGRWETLREICVSRRQAVLVPIMPRRFAFLRLRLSGCGAAALYGIAKVLEQGSEL